MRRLFVASLWAGVLVWVLGSVPAIATRPAPPGLSARARRRLESMRARLVRRLRTAERERRPRGLEALRCRLGSIELQLGRIEDAARHLRVPEGPMPGLDLGRCELDGASVQRATGDSAQALVLAQRALRHLAPSARHEAVELIEALVQLPDLPCASAGFREAGGDPEQLVREVHEVASSAVVRGACGYTPPRALGLSSCVGFPTAPSSTRPLEDLRAFGRGDGAAHVRTREYCVSLPGPSERGVEHVTVEATAELVLVRHTVEVPDRSACDEAECGVRYRVVETVLDRSRGAVLTAHVCDADPTEGDGPPSCGTTIDAETLTLGGRAYRAEDGLVVPAG